MFSGLGGSAIGGVATLPASGNAGAPGAGEPASDGAGSDCADAEAAQSSHDRQSACRSIYCLPLRRLHHHASAIQPNADTSPLPADPFSAQPPQPDVACCAASSAGLVLGPG